MIKMYNMPVMSFIHSFIYWEKGEKEEEGRLSVEYNIKTWTLTDRYILFDGDVDALWVENMNSVMDDNRLLTLANGERIRLQSHCAMLFEVSQNFPTLLCKAPFRALNNET